MLPHAIFPGPDIKSDDDLPTWGYHPTKNFTTVGIILAVGLAILANTSTRILSWKGGVFETPALRDICAFYRNGSLFFGCA